MGSGNCGKLASLSNLVPSGEKRTRSAPRSTTLESTLSPRPVSGYQIALVVVISSRPAPDPEVGNRTIFVRAPEWTRAIRDLSSRASDVYPTAPASPGEFSRRMEPDESSMMWKPGPGAFWPSGSPKTSAVFPSALPRAGGKTALVLGEPLGQKASFHRHFPGPAD